MSIRALRGIALLLLAVCAAIAAPHAHDLTAADGSRHDDEAHHLVLTRIAGPRP